MKKVIKNPKKMKNAMYIVFGVFALALFAITRIHPSYANEGLMIDNALDSIVLYGEVEQLPEDEEVEEVQDEEAQEIEQNQEVEEEEDIVEPEETSDEEINEEEKTSEDLDETILERDNKEIDKTENKEEPQVNEENHGVSDENKDNEENKQEQKVEKEEIVNENKEENVGASEEFGFKSPENRIAEEVQPNIIESEEIYGTGEYEGVKVEVYAQTGLFASGTVLTIEPVIEEKLEQVKEVLSGELEIVEEEEEQTVIAFDITFRDPITQEELQPKNGTVQVTFNYEENENLVQAEENEEQEVKVYHLNDKDEEGEKIEEITGALVEEVVINEEKSEEENVLVVEAESFSVYTIIIKNTSNQEIQKFSQSYEDLTLYLVDSNGNSSYYTIMDRNLGATEIFNQDYDNPNTGSYGYHYQWGNNYGFESCIENGCTDFPGGETSEYWSFNTNYFPGKFSIDKWNPNKPLSASTSNAWGGDENSILNKKGPCPTNYHIPNYEEWNSMYEKWKQASVLVDWKSYGSDFLLPFAGYRDSSKKICNQGEEGYYQTLNQRYAGQTFVNKISKYSINASYTSYYYGYSMRCFKNTSTFNVQVNANGGNKFTIGIDGNKISSLGIPQKDNSIFKGWYSDSAFTDLVEKGDTVPSKLYAKFECKLGYKEIGTQCILDDNGFIVKFHPNGGFFSGMSVDSHLEVEYQWNGNAFTPNILLQIPNRETENSNIQSGWMFAGWYTKSGENNDWGNEFSLGLSNLDLVNSNGVVYAKWLPFNDLPIKDGEKVLFTVMDRNLGASAVSEGVYQNFNLDEFGFYYQWGNNYGFSNNPNIVLNKSENQSDASSYNPNNYYLDDTFVIKKSSWDLANNGNLWGGLGDTDKQRGEGTDVNRKGPCPVGYHVPSEIEWRMAYKGWYNSESKSIDMDSMGKNFAKDFKMPFAGYRYYYDSEVNGQGSYTAYRTSSPSNNNSNYSYALDFYSNNVSYGRTEAKANGYPVRCFKNTIETSKKLLYLTETGEKIAEYDFIWWEPISSNYRPENPRREGYEFVGWYESGSDEEYDFSQDRTKNLTLYEKWVLIGGGENPDIAKLAVGSKVNAIIKTLSAGEPVSYNEQDVLIEGFERSPVLPEGGNKRLISAEDSDAQIFAWFDSEDKKIKYYTNAKDVYLNEDSSYTFYYLKNLKSFNVNDFKTDYVSNMEKMFSYSFTSVEGLTLDFTKMNLSNVKNMKEMFAYDFSKIWQSNELPTITGVTIDFSNTDLSNVETMYQMFFANYQTVNSVSGIKIDFSNANMNDVTTMYQMFGNNYQQISNGVSSVLIDFTDAKMNSVKNMKYMLEDMFENVSNHTNGITISLENVKLPNVEDMSYMFTRDFSSNSNRSGIYINMKNMEVGHDTVIDDMFENIFNNGGTVEGVKIDLSNSNFRGRKDMSGIFESTFCRNGNVSGVVLDFSNSLYGTNSLYHFLGYAFQSSSNVSGVQIFFNNADFGGVTSMNNMFQGVFTYGNGNVEGISIDFENSDLSNVSTMKEMFDYAFQSQTNVKGISINFKNVDLKNLTMMNAMFRNAFKPSNILSGVLLEFSNSIFGKTDMGDMFQGALSQVGNIKGFLIDFSNTNMSNVERMSNIFQSFGTYGTDAEGIIIDFSNADISNIEDMSHMFDGIFSDKNNLKEVIISFKNTDLSNVRTMSDMFDRFAYGINVLSGVTIDFSEADLSKVENMHYMFQGFANNYNGNSINSVAIKWNKAKFTSSLTKMSYMFNSCQVEELDLSNFDTSNVTTMENMFYNAKNLKTIYVGSRFRTNNVTNSNSMFSTNTKLEGGRGTKYSDSNPRDKTYARIDRVGEPGYFTKKGDEIVATLLPGQEFNAKIKTIAKGNSAMYSDSDIYIKRIKEGTKDQMIMEYLENGTLEKVSTTDSEKPVYARYSDNDKTIYYYSEADVIDMNTDATNMFSNLTKLEEFDLEGIETRGVTIMSGMFMNDSSLVELNFENRNLGSVKNIQNMFNGCSNLEKINFSNADMQSITGFNGVFTVLPKLEEIKFSNANLINLKSTNGMFGGSSNLEYADFSDADMRKVIDMISMFGGNSKLKKVNFRNANLRNLNSVNSMFGGSSLQYANFDDANMPKLGNMSSMFGGCGNLTGVTFSGTKLGNVTDMSYMFGGDSKLREVIITDKLTKLESAYEMFGGCSGLTGIDLSNFEFVSLTNLQGMFDSATNLKFINFGNNDFKNATNLKDIFLNCSNLEEINLSKFDTSNVTNMKNMFKNATNLKTIYIGDNFSTENVTESTDMFLGAVALVGGNGTTYDENHIDKEYARADKSGTPGYFTLGEFSIIYNLEGGDMGDMKTSYKLGESFVIGQPTKEENIFLGWTGSNGNTPELVVEIQQGTIGDLEFTANWKVNQYKIIFDTDGGNAINPIVIDYNSLLTGINLQTPTKECNEFSGWNIELPERMPAHDITLKAVWNYTCSKSSGGGGGGGGGSSTVKTKDDKDDHGVADEEKNINLEKEENKSIEIQDNQVVENQINQEITQKVDNNSKKDVDTETVVDDTTTSNNSSYTSEQKQSYEFAKSNGITTTTSIEQAKMNISLTRIEMAKMLSYYAINVLGQEPDAEKGVVKFSDVTNKLDKEYDNGVTLAYQLGIMGQNMPNNKFRPNDEVTRAEFATALSRLLYNTDEGEYKGTRKYYEPHIAKLYNEGIINKTDPKMKEKRGYVMIMLMRTAQ